MSYFSGINNKITFVIAMLFKYLRIVPPPLFVMSGQGNNWYIREQGIAKEGTLGSKSVAKASNLVISYPVSAGMSAYHDSQALIPDQS